MVTQVRGRVRVEPFNTDNLGPLKCVLITEEVPPSHQSPILMTWGWPRLECRTITTCVMNTHICTHTLTHTCTCTHIQTHEVNPVSNLTAHFVDAIHNIYWCIRILAWRHQQKRVLHYYIIAIYALPNGHTCDHSISNCAESWATYSCQSKEVVYVLIQSSTSDGCKSLVRLLPLSNAATPHLCAEGELVVERSSGGELACPIQAQGTTRGPGVCNVSTWGESKGKERSFCTKSEDLFSTTQCS